MSKTYIQYGCGFSAPEGWRNFDASPTLKLERMPVIGGLINKNSAPFPDRVEYGNVITGLPVANDSCDGVYASHVLEHLSLNDFRIALKNTHHLLKPGGIFRLIVPDLKVAAQQYVASNDSNASHDFLQATSLGIVDRPKGLGEFIKSYFGNSLHLWMWDLKAISLELDKVGYKDIRACHFGDSRDSAFNAVEDSDRFENAVAVECVK